MIIWDWAYREVFLNEGDNDFCLKKLKKYREKEYLWLIKMKFNSRIYTLLKFWIKDFNYHDYIASKKISRVIPENIPIINEYTKDWLKQSIIRDYNWNISKNIESISVRLPDSFYEELLSIVNLLMENWIYLLDIANNILVQEYEEWKFKPILFDFKRVWWRTYMFQPWLIIDNLKNKR